MAMEGMTSERLRAVYSRVLARTLPLTRSVPEAEDAVQDAIERALLTWPRDGAPENAEAWLVTVAANCFRDRVRHAHRVERHRDVVAVLAETTPWLRIPMSDPAIAQGWNDELLALVFACCHPSLAAGECAALALATVIGLSVSEIAVAFGVAPRTMEQRLTRARVRLRERGDADGAPPERSHDRLAAVLRVLYVLFDEGYWSTDDDAPIRADLCRLALGLARSLHATYPDAGEVVGLLCLLELHEARRPGRLDAHGSPIALPDQDRSRWDHDAITRAAARLEATLATQAAGPFLIEAAISAVHGRARAASETDWTQVAALYDLLEPLRPNTAVRVNRAYAVSRVRGAEAGLALLDGIDDPYVHLVRGVLLCELGREGEARDALALAERHARNAVEATQIRARIHALGSRTT